MKKTKRDYLRDYSRANSDIERFQVCIDVLEDTNTEYSSVNSMIKKLKSMQQKCLKKIDVAAAKLGAPYEC